MNDNDNNDLKKETTEAISQVREVIKNVDIKEETERTKGFFLEMLGNPIGKIKEVSDSEAKFLSVAIVIMAVWTASAFLRSVIFAISRTWRFVDILPRIVNIITSTISPVAVILALTLGVYVFYKDKFKKLMPVVITIIIASSPRAAGAVLSILSALIPGSAIIISSASAFLYLISVVLVYFALKALVGEDEDEKFFISFIKIQCVYFVARIVLGAFGVSI